MASQTGPPAKTYLSKVSRSGCSHFWYKYLMMINNEKTASINKDCWENLDSLNVINKDLSPVKVRSGLVGSQVEHQVSSIQMNIL